MVRVSKGKALPFYFPSPPGVPPMKAVTQCRPIPLTPKGSWPASQLAQPPKSLTLTWFLQEEGGGGGEVDCLFASVCSGCSSLGFSMRKWLDQRPEPWWRLIVIVRLVEAGATYQGLSAPSRRGRAGTRGPISGRWCENWLAVASALLLLSLQCVRP